MQCAKHSYGAGSGSVGMMVLYKCKTSLNKFGKKYIVLLRILFYFVSLISKKNHHNGIR